MLNPRRLSAPEVALTEQRRETAMHLQAIEGNPLTPNEIVMFEIFEQEAWTHEQRRAYLRAQGQALAAE
jgi:hypothetical protein